jgi:hypothetical protein
MLKRTVAWLVVALVFTGTLLAEETRGSITKIEDGSITIRTIVVRPDPKKGAIGTPEEKTFKIGNDVKVVRVMEKRKEDLKLTIAEVKTALKVGKITVAITHDGGTCSVIKVLPPGKGG